MKLLTKAQHAKLFANGKASAIKEQDHFPVVKLFTHDDHAEIPSPISLKWRPRWAGIRT